MSRDAVSKAIRGFFDLQLVGPDTGFKPEELADVCIAAMTPTAHYQCRICGGNPTAFPYKPEDIFSTVGRQRHRVAGAGKPIDKEHS